MKWCVNTYATLPSTQDELKEFINDGASEGMVVQALEQTAGRGRHGSTWTSPLGNLYMSILLQPSCNAIEAGQISFIGALAVSHAINEYTDLGTRKKLKWPNDVLIDKKKCAGILLETSLTDTKVDWVILGMGINILSAPEEGVALKNLSERPIPIHPFRDKVLEHIKKLYQLWQEEGFQPIRQQWLAEAYNLNETIRINIPNQEKTGIFTDLDSSGALVLKKDENQTEKISSGEIVVAL